MFVFIIPRTPVKLRTPLRDDLWEISKKSLMSQTSNDWKALIIGVPNESERTNPHFVFLEKDEFTKKEKIKFALDFLRENANLRADYLIRFDDDDVFSKIILSEVAESEVKFDCIYDKFHTYIDPVYMKISCKRNNWIANTAIHAYEHAVKVCGPKNQQLLMQDHDEYWHTYYKDKNTFSPELLKPVYFRVLSPYSITGRSTAPFNAEIDWTKYSAYLRGYGPWITLPENQNFHNELKNISERYFKDKPSRSFFYWLVNRLKFSKNRF